MDYSAKWFLEFLTARKLDASIYRHNAKIQESVKLIFWCNNSNNNNQKPSAISNAEDNRLPLANRIICDTRCARTQTAFALEIPELYNVVRRRVGPVISISAGLGPRAARRAVPRSLLIGCLNKSPARSPQPAASSQQQPAAASQPYISIDSSIS